MFRSDLKHILNDGENPEDEDEYSDNFDEEDDEEE